MEDALIAFLLADTPLAALVGTKIHYDASPQDTAEPRVVIEVISRVPVYADDGEAGLTQHRLQITSWGTSKSSTLSVSAAVYARLSAVSETYSGVDFQTIELDDEDSRFETLADGRELYRVRQDYIIWHNA